MRIQLASATLLVSLMSLLFVPAGTTHAGDETEVLIEVVLTGAHDLLDNGSITFRAGYQDGSGQSPLVAAVVVDGWLWNLTPGSDLGADGTYEIALPSSDGCREYYFHFVDALGTPHRYPATGALLTRGEGGCPVGYVEESLAAREAQQFGFFVLSDEGEETIAVYRTHFLLHDRANVHLTVHDVAGKTIRELLSRDMPAGMHNATWDGKNHDGVTMSAGLYFYRLRFRQAEKDVALVLPEASSQH